MALVKKDFSQEELSIFFVPKEYMLISLKKKFYFSAAKLPQSFPTLCDSVNYNLPGFSIQGILQARILEWVTVPSSRGSCPPRDQTQVTLYLLSFATSTTWEVPNANSDINTTVKKLTMSTR